MVKILNSVSLFEEVKETISYLHVHKISQQNETLKSLVAHVWIQFHRKSIPPNKHLKEGGTFNCSEQTTLSLNGRLHCHSMEGERGNLFLLRGCSYEPG